MPLAYLILSRRTLLPSPIIPIFLLTHLLARPLFRLPWFDRNLELIDEWDSIHSGGVSYAGIS